MRTVGGDRRRAGFSHHPTLHRRQADRDSEASADQPEADLEHVQRHGKNQPLDGLERHHERCARQKARLGEGGDSLALAVPEAMCPIRRALRVMDAQERDEARAGVDKRVDR